MLKLTELSAAHKSTDNLHQRPYKFCVQSGRELDPCALPRSRMRFASRIIDKSSASLIALIVRCVQIRAVIREGKSDETGVLFGRNVVECAYRLARSCTDIAI
jgi:hypothetical protein